MRRLKNGRRASRETKRAEPGALEQVYAKRISTGAEIRPALRSGPTDPAELQREREDLSRKCAQGPHELERENEI
jgi:hypothetical protein